MIVFIINVNFGLRINKMKKKVWCKNCKYLIHFHNDYGSSFDFCRAYFFPEENTSILIMWETLKWNKKGNCKIYKRKWYKF